MKPLNGWHILMGGALAMILAASLGHRWLALGWNASHYPVAASSARTQIVVDGAHAYIAAGAEGIEVIDLATQKRRALVPPEAPADRVDDLALAEGWLFALDATPPGHLMIYSLSDPDRPSWSSEIVPVPVGPFS